MQDQQQQGQCGRHAVPALAALLLLCLYFRPARAARPPLSRT